MTWAVLSEPSFVHSFCQGLADSRAITSTTLLACNSTRAATLSTRSVHGAAPSRRLLHQHARGVHQVVGQGIEQQAYLVVGEGVD